MYPCGGSGAAAAVIGDLVQFPTLPKEWLGKYVKGQMYKYQETLPKLPVPSLQQTLRKYLIGVKVGCISLRWSVFSILKCILHIENLISIVV